MLVKIDGNRLIIYKLKEVENRYQNIFKVLSLTEKSNIASNRLIKNKGQDITNELIPDRYLEEERALLYKKFPFKQKLHKSTFYKYLKSSGQFKKPHR